MHLTVVAVPGRPNAPVLQATRAAASAWQASHPEITGGILDQARALQVGIGIFGQLLS